MPPPILQFFDANGLPLVGGKLYSYVAGTVTPHATYLDSGLSSPNANPIILDGDGKCVVWIDATAYKFVLQDSLGVVQWTRDNVQIIPDGSITTIKLADGSVTTIKIADGAITTPKILDANVTTAKIADNAITPAKIPDSSIPTTKLVSSTEIGFVETSDPRFGDGPTAYPRKPWSAPALIAVPASPAVGDGQCVRWSPNGKILAVAENNTDFVALFSRFGPNLVKMSPGIIDPPFTTGSVVAISPDGDYVLAAGGVSTLLFQRCGSTFGNVLNPATAIAGQVNAADWCSNGDYFAIAHEVSPYISIVKRTDTDRTNVVANYYSVNAQIVGVAAHIINYEVKVIDNANAVATGASWTFTVPRRNGYRIVARAYPDLPNSQYAINSKIELFLNRNSVPSIRLDKVVVAASITENPSVSGEFHDTFEAGEVIQIVVDKSFSTNITLASAAGENNISIVEDPGYGSLSLFTLLSNPASLPAGGAKSCKFSPDGNFLAVGHTTTPFVTIYQRTGDTFAKCADPVALPAAAVLGLSWSPDSSILTCVHGTTPFITNYSRSSATFTKMTAPVALPAGQGNGAAWNHGGNKLAIAHAITPFITIYSWDGATFTKDADPGALPASTGLSVSWTPDDQFLTVGHVNSPYMSTYQTAGANGANAVTYVKQVNLV